MRSLTAFFILISAGNFACAESSGEMNSLMIIAPYKRAELWVFDDPQAGLKQEPFVSGADHIMDLLTASIPDAENGFALVFSAQPFPGYQAHFVRERSEHGGTWYTWPDRSVEGWLCPALFKYFPAAPPEIYVQARPGKKVGPAPKS